MIGGGVSLYIYPDNLKSKAMLWLWELRDIGIVGIGCLISVFALAQLGLILPIVFTAAYAFLSIRIEDSGTGRAVYLAVGQCSCRHHDY